MADSSTRKIVNDLQKKLGDAMTVSMMGDGLSPAEPTDFFTTGVPLLDKAIGGGFPCGRLSEIYGDVATGKTVLLLTSMALAQRRGAICAFLDTERASTKAFAKKLAGIDDTNLINLHPKTQQDLWKAVFHVIRYARVQDEQAPIFIGIDSLAGVGSAEELQAGFDDEARMARAAQIIRSAMRILVQEYAEKRVTLVFTNQEIFKIGVPVWAEKTQSWGGTAPKYFSSVRLKLDQLGWEKEGDERIGAKIRATVVKNRFNPPGMQIHYTIYNRGPLAGIDTVGSVFTYLYAKHALGSTRGFVEWDGRKVRPGPFLAELRRDPQLVEALKARAYEVFDAAGCGEEDPEVVEGYDG